MTAEREALVAIAEQLVDQHGEPWPNGSESDRLHYWRDKAISAANAIRQALANPATIRDTDKDAEAIKRVEKWLDGGCSSWGVPAQDIRALLNRLHSTPSNMGLREALETIAGPPERDPELSPIYEPRWSAYQCREIARRALASTPAEPSCSWCNAERVPEEICACNAPAEPREASGYCPFCMTADPVAPAEGDEPTEAMIEAGMAAVKQAGLTMSNAMLIRQWLPAIYRAMSQRKAEPDASGDRKPPTR